MNVLIFAYACEPGHGSEPGAGWVWSRMVARMGEAWVITRESNRSLIEAALPDLPEAANLHFEYVDLPARARAWKRGARGARLYYLLWQMAALRRARGLLRRTRFDLIWHLTWANAWIGTLAPLARGPLVYGPVGGGVGMDWSLVSALGLRGAVFEAARALARGGARFLNPLARLAWHRADLILTQNPDTVAWLPTAHRPKAHVFPHIVLDERASAWGRSNGRIPSHEALFVGRLLPWKGVALALRAVTLLPDWTLTVCGSGYDERRLRRLSERLGVADRVRFRGWVAPDVIRQLMRECDVFLFPSIHDEGGWVVAEALASGLPVVCLDRGGPPAIGGRGVAVTGVAGTVENLARAVLTAGESELPPFPSIDASTDRLRSLLVVGFPGLDVGDRGSRGSGSPVAESRARSSGDDRLPGPEVEAADSGR